MGKLKVVQSRPLPPEAQAYLEKDDRIDLVLWPEDKTADRKWLLEHIKGSDGLLCMIGDGIDEELMQTAGEKLRVVSTMSAGFDHVETQALKKRGIRLGVTPDALTDAVADIGVLLALSSTRRGGETMRVVLDGKWPQSPWAPLLFCGQSLSRSTVGFVGFGRIAQATLQRLLAFGVSRCVYLSSRPGKPASQDFYNLIANQPVPIQPAKSADELARESDLVVVACALTQDTKHLINSNFLSQMKPTASVVNIARGGIVHSDALAEALREGKIFGAGLDVVEGEPNIDAHHPLVQEPRCVVLPHIGSATIQTREQMAKDSVDNLLGALFAGNMISEKKL